MDWLLEALFLGAAACYVAASAVLLRYLVSGQGEASVLGPRLIATGAVLHAGQIFVASSVLAVCPVEGVHFPMSIAAMLMCIGYVAVRRKFSIEAAGAFIAPLALLSLVGSRFVARGVEPSARVKSVVLPFHITTNVLGIALFTLASADATLYLIQENLLKRKQIDGVFRRLPPLDVLDRAEHRFMLAGFPMLTIGVITGSLRLGGGATGEVLRTVFGYVTWVVIASVLYLRASAGWRGRRAAYGTIAGFGLSLAVLAFYLVRGSLGTRASAMAAHLF